MNTDATNVQDEKMEAAEPRTHAINIGDLGRENTVEQQGEIEIALNVSDLDLYYGEKQALKKVNMEIPRNRVTAFIGPSGCGKSTLLRCFNRMNDLVDNVHIDGLITLDGEDIHSKQLNVAELRRRIGMVFQKPNPFPKSIYENVAYGLRILGIKDKRRLD